jgi:hypothetical protein
MITLLILGLCAMQAITYTCNPVYNSWNGDYMTINCQPPIGSTFNVSMNCSWETDKLYYYFLDKCKTYSQAHTIINLYLFCNHSSIVATNSSCEIYYAIATENNTWGLIQGDFSSFTYTDPYTGNHMMMNILPYTITDLDMDHTPRAWRNHKFMDVSKNVSNFNGAFGMTNSGMYPNAYITTFNALAYNNPL